MKLLAGFGVRLTALLVLSFSIAGAAEPASRSGECLKGIPPGLQLWWTFSSAAKVRPQTPAPSGEGEAVRLYCARNETEAAQLVVRSEQALAGVRWSGGKLVGATGQGFIPTELLQAEYLEVRQATDSHSETGPWPDPLTPVRGPIDLAAGMNHAFWVRVSVPKDAVAGRYQGRVRLDAGGMAAEVPVDLVVYDFALPDRSSCATAFGFSPELVFLYHGLTNEAHKRLVLDKYLANLAAHRVAPYDPAPLDRFRVTWSEVRPPRSPWQDWSGVRLVTNEVHSGTGALLVYDDQPKANVTVAYEPLVRIPEGGLRFRGWYRTAVPGHRFLVTFNHHDGEGKWMPGRNNDIVLAGNGQWQELDLTLTAFPAGAVFLRLHLRAAVWTDAGEELGLVWFDDLSFREVSTGREWLTGGDFERKPRTKLVTNPENLRVRFDFSSWDAAMERAMDQYHFTSFQVPFPGLGGGTFHAIDAPNLLGFTEEDPEYELLLASYGKQLETHLRERGWLDRAFVYWFDEPSPDQYGFVMNGFEKLKRHAPGLTRMLTEQVEPGLIGGPNLWCPISNEYDPEPARARRQAGDRFWWYVCTGPKAPYAGLFIDHPAPEMRIWVWQTWQRGIEGLLVWQINYWTSDTAYPDRGQPQNPYTDPMSWTTGYGTPAGQRLPWGNGDGRFIYPPAAAAQGVPVEPVLEGPVDSIRWEQLRDGIEDYEYLRILRDRLERAQAGLPPAEAAAFAALLSVPETITRSMTDFAADGAPIEARRRQIAAAIERLGEP